MRALSLLLLCTFVTACSDAGPPPEWLTNARVFVDGVHATSHDCRTGICKHNENTDLVAWQGALWLVHRTAESQVLGQNSALHIYRSSDGGAHFVETGLIPAPAPGTPLGGTAGRDLRDP